MYIKAKDGIYEIEDEITITPYLDEGWEKVFKIVDSNKCIKEQDVIVQADNLAELCDEFVYIEYKKPRVLDRVITREIKEKGIKAAETIYCHPNWNGIIYGAIWTDKGLIYVAKMNEKGELVLI